MTKPEPTAEEISYDDLSDQYADETNLDPNTYRGDVETAFVCGMMKADEINQSRLQAIAEEVEEELKAYDITDHLDKTQVYDALEASNPQEVGEIKQLIWFYHLITKHLDQ